MGYRFRGNVFIQTIYAEKEQKIEHKQQQQQRVSAYLFMRLLVVRDGLCWTLYIFTVRSRAILCVTRSFCDFPCVLYESKLDSIVHYVSIICNPVHSLWPRIGLCCRFSNPVRSQCYSLESTSVEH